MFRWILSFLSITAVLCGFSVASAQNTPSDIGAVMERMDDNFKLISNGLRAGNLDASHVDGVEAFQSDATEAALLPLSSQAPCAQLAYQTTMLELISEALEMENQMEIAIAAGSPQDLEAVTGVWRKMSDLRKQGHQDCQE